MQTRRSPLGKSKPLWAVAALLLVNAVLLTAQPGLALTNALPRSLGNYFFGPKLVRAEVLVKDAAGTRVYRVDRGVIRNKAGGSLVLRGRDGTVGTIPISPAAKIILHGRPAAYSALRRGMVATVIRDGDAPAIEVRAGRQ